jgi:GT2 family glycosyltransferase
VKSLRKRLSVVVLTYNRAAELRRTLRRMQSLPERLPLIVVDNASHDNTAAMVRQEFPEVQLISLSRNIGAAARNIGVGHSQTPYVAFCDDDTWWAPGGLELAAALLDAHSNVAVLSARVLVGPDASEDPTCTAMASSPLPNSGLPGPMILGFLAGAAVIRRGPFMAVGGYESKFFLGGEEALVTLDLVSLGWKIVYSAQLIVHHYPSAVRDLAGRHHYLVRNALLVAWLRLPLLALLNETLRLCRTPYGTWVLLYALAGAFRELPWVLRRRKVVADETAQWYSMLTRR